MKRLHAGPRSHQIVTSAVVMLLSAACMTCQAQSTGSVQAPEAAVLQGVVNLSASATSEVGMDWLSATLSTVREGADAATVQAGLKQALDTALQEARRVAKPGQIEVRTGNFSLSPRYTPKGVINGWQGQVELVVEGKDMGAIGQLAGRINTLTIGRVNYSLSREMREKVEGEITAQAISSYRAKAADVAKQFGYGGYVIREVAISGSELPPISPMMMREKAMSIASADAGLPVEAGKATVTVSVNGAVQLKP